MQFYNTYFFCTEYGLNNRPIRLHLILVTPGPQRHCLRYIRDCPLCFLRELFFHDEEDFWRSLLFSQHEWRYLRNICTHMGPIAIEFSNDPPIIYFLSLQLKNRNIFFHRFHCFFFFLKLYYVLIKGKNIE